VLQSFVRRALVLWAIPVFIVLPVRADPNSASAQQEDQGQLEAVIVTAQRRSENLQTTPLTVTVASGTELLNEGVADTASLSLAVPGLSYTLSGFSATPFIRGVGTTTSAAGAEASVATYIDGVYLSSPNASLFELNNIDRIEVLKGPQGTLFGRNATGGVIQIITKDPSSTPSADIQVGYANYATSSASFYGTTGLGEGVAMNLTAYGTNQANGWGTDLTTGQPTFTRHDFGGRSKVLWVPAAGTRIIIAVDYNSARNENGLGWHVVPPGIGIGGVTRYHGFYDTYDNPNDSWDVSQTGLSVTAAQDLPVARLINITSWRYVKGAELFDEDATPLEVVAADSLQHAKTITEELHLLSKDDALFPWISGIYYFHDRSDYDPVSLTGLFVAPLDGTQIRSALKSESYAAFGQVTPQIATNTHLTLGARITKDERAVTGSTLGLAGSEPIPLGTASQSTSWSKVTWRAALDHQFTPGLMAYISDDRGFKSGLYNSLTYSSPPVRPETLDAYQFGVKTEFDQHRLRLNAAGFYYDYKDIQVQEVITGAVELTNAAAARMKGMDVDLTFLPIDTLTLRGGFEWMSGHYTSFENAQFVSPTLGPSGDPVGGNTQTVGNATDFDTVRTPKRTGTVSAAYRVSVPGGNLEFVISDYYNSGFAWDPDNRLRQSSYDILNASVDWGVASSAWGIRLWGRNLTRTQYCAFETASALNDACSPAPPRTYGMTLSARF
jgi:iron complex outermembrane recepter protein